MATTQLMTEAERQKEQLTELRLQVSLLHDELLAYRDEEQHPNRLQGKVRRQSIALTRLNKRVRMQRLILRELTEQNPELANDLFHTVLDKYSSELDDEVILKF